MRTALPTIYGDADIPNEGDLVFTRLEPIANRTTVDAKPDFYDGASLATIDTQIRSDIGSFIIPTRHATAPVVPNFFMEAKPPKGGADVAKRQACYDGALGARAMHKLQSYGQDEPVYDGNAYTISTTYHDGTLKMYTTHPTAGPGNSTEYHMTQLRSLALTDTPDSFRQGATVFRNAIDWAQEQRDRFISAANERARSMNIEPSPFESSDHNDVSDPTEVQGVTHLTQVEDPEDDCQYYMSQQALQGGYMNNELSNFASESPTFESSDYNGYSETTDTYPAEESETSPDELALDTYPKSTVSNKRRNNASEKTVSKAPRHSDGKSGRRRRSKK
jgi:hypothetical protein